MIWFSACIVTDNAASTNVLPQADTSSISSSVKQACWLLKISCMVKQKTNYDNLAASRAVVLARFFRKKRTVLSSPSAKETLGSQCSKFFARLMSG
jgi:hypothetical protein